jgi:hypothetical protein
MVVHAVYDSGRHGFKSTNHPALAWFIAHAFGNFFGAGVRGFMQTLPQINLYTHGTQWTNPIMQPFSNVKLIPSILKFLNSFVNLLTSSILSIKSLPITFLYQIH